MAVIMIVSSRSVAARVLAIQVVVAALVVGLSVLLAYRQADRRAEEVAAGKVTDIARTLAATADASDGLTSADPAGALGALAERERTRTGTDFVVIMSPDGTRFTHPNPALVGGRYAGSIAAAQAGGVVVEQYAGSLGPSTRAVVPVMASGRVIGLVAVGLLRSRVGPQVRTILPELLLPGLAAGFLSGGGAWLVARRVRRDTLGLNARELSRMHEHHDALLHAVREGLLIVDPEGTLEVINDEATRLLGIPPDALGRRIADLGLPESLVELMTGPGQHADVAHASSGRVLLVSANAVRRGGRHVATLTTLRDRTELEELTGQLGVATSLADALHAQTHEAANRLHSVITLVEMGQPERAVEFATEELQATQRHRDTILGAIEEPALAALLLGEAAKAAEFGIDLRLDPEAHLPAGVLPPREGVTILGNLLDNAIESLRCCPAQEERSIIVDVQADAQPGLGAGTAAPGYVVLTVADTGTGLTDEGARRAFERGWSTKDSSTAAGRGIGLAIVQQSVHILGGTVTVSPPPGATFTVRLPQPSMAPGDRLAAAPTDAVTTHG